MKIRMSIQRKINTAAYENVVITVDIEREHETQNLSEEKFKASVRKEIIELYRDSEAAVLEELKLGKVVAHQESKPDAAKPPVKGKKILTDDDLKDIL